MKFFISDTHFYHKNIIKYEDRPFNNVFDMNEQIIKNWNQKVLKSDEVYILGDFAFCSGKEANVLLDRLNGRKYLIKGNHDSFLKDKDFIRDKFVWIKDYARIKVNEERVILFHYPIAVWDCKHHDAIHLYGHIHSNKDTNHPLTFELENAYNVGVDVNDLEPKTLNELINGK